MKSLVLTARIESENPEHTCIGVFQNRGKAGVLVVNTWCAAEVLQLLNTREDREWTLFHCLNDKCWIVCKLVGDIHTGVAEVPDERTGRAVMEAMRERDERMRRE